MDSKIVPRFIHAYCSWLYWTGLCAIYVLLEDSGSYTAVDICYLQAFGSHKVVNRWDTKGSKVPVTNLQMGLENRYFIADTAKKDDWFCIYEWEFDIDGCKQTAKK